MAVWMLPAVVLERLVQGSIAMSRMTTAPDVSVLVCKLRGVVGQVRNHQSSLGLARGWIMRRQPIMQRRIASRAAYKSFTAKWEARVADLEAERKAAVGAVADSLALAGQADERRLVDVLIRLRDALRFGYLGLRWDVLANSRLGADDVDAAVMELDRLASGLVVLQPVANRTEDSAPVPTHPVWDSDRRELRYNGLVKTFRQKAKNQTAVLSAFESDGWPARIDWPVRDGAVADTVRSLMDWAPKRGLIFERDGNDGIIWKQAPPEHP